MKQIIVFMIAFAFPVLGFGQMKKFEYTPKVKNKLEIKNMPGAVELGNSTGVSIVIESNFDLEKPRRAEGLKLLGSKGDNTDMNLNVAEENGIVTIEGATNNVTDYKYRILIPVGIAVKLDYSNPFARGDVAVGSFQGSLEIKTLSANVRLKDCTGPLAVSSISGNVEVSFSRISQDEPTSLASVSGYLDISVPASEKATFEISSITGNVYNNLDLKSPSQEENNQRAYGLKDLKKNSGKVFLLNGGGQKIFLKDISGDIYLRKR